MSDIVAIHGSHNAALAFATTDSTDIRVIEIERLIGYKNAGLAQYKTVPSPDQVVLQALDIAKQWGFGLNGFDLCLSTNIDCVHGYPDGRWEKVFYNRNIPAKEYKFGPTHHYCHACGTFYQSSFDKAVIVSFDGGGDDGFFNVFVAESRAEGPKLIAQYPYDLGFAYMVFGEYISEIRKEGALSDGNLIYSGKLMGLCGYGKVVSEWVEPMRKFYMAKPDGNNYRTLISALSSEIGITLSVDQRLSGEVGYNLAATSQKVFEDLFLEFVGPMIFDTYQSYPVCITGGCGLNVLLNTEIKKRKHAPVFVAPNSSDCGIAVGNLLAYLKPASPVNVIYAGLPLLDKDSVLHHWYSQSSGLSAEPVSNSRMIELLKAGKIIGVARGNSEHGPRALGNRSILCDPTFPDMKDILNEKVKHREWYRPFAPVVRNEDADDYFNILEESPYMSFAFYVRPEWRSRLSSITHVDGTARVQTLRREVNPWLYDLLEDYKKEVGHGVLLNTSFNVNGRPILSTVAEGFQLLTNTKLDGILIENTLILKK